MSSRSLNLLVCLGACCTFATHAAADPIIRVITIHTGNVRDIEEGETVFVFGVRPQEQFEFEFIVENVGDGFLSASRVEADFSSGITSRSFGHSSTPDGFVGRVGFRPDEIGPFGIQVSVTTNLPDSPFVFQLEGVVRAPIMTLSNDGFFVSRDQGLEMAPVAVGESVAAVIDAKNSGNTTLQFEGEPQVVELTGNGDADEITLTLPERVDAQTIGEIVVNFRPQSTGAREFLVTLPTNDPDSPHEFVVEAEALASFADCNSNNIDDLDEVATGAAADCDGNGEPDECQSDTDGDDVIDPCDVCPGEDDRSDTDGDLVPDCLDNCPDVANRDQVDTDADGIGDDCDVSDVDPSGDGGTPFEDCNENGVDDRSDIDGGFSSDCNRNGVPDECEADDDGDNVINDCDFCPGEDDTIDQDGDGVPSCVDNCPAVANPLQRDADDDGIGDPCDGVDDSSGNEDTSAEVAGTFCGAGVATILPFTMFGLIGLRPRAPRAP